MIREIFHKVEGMASHVLPNPAHYLHPLPGRRIFISRFCNSAPEDSIKISRAAA
jgi:hypothetical protein